jgi:PKD repeat protein
VPTNAELRQLRLRRIRQVRPNTLAITRKNKELQRQGQPQINLAYAQKPENETEIDTRADIASTAEAGASTVQTVAAVTAIPGAVDNSVLPAFPPIGYQGKEGSCGAWISTYYLASHEICLARGCNNKTSDANIMSPRWTYNMFNRGLDTGISPLDAYVMLERNGAVSLRELPYVAGEYRKWPTEGALWRTALSNRMNPFQTLTAISTPAGLTNLKQLLANGHVANVLIYFLSFNYATVAVDPAESSPYAGQNVVTHVTGSQGPHGLTIVGYDDSIWVDLNQNGMVDAGEKGAFKAANSWSTSWANGGYIWFAYDALKAVSAVAGGPASSTRRTGFIQDSAYTLTARADYQPRLIAEFTVNNLMRDQMSLTVGMSAAGATAPTTTFASGALRYRGGPYPLDGGTSAVDGTFALDLTDVMPATPATANYYLTLSDSSTGNPSQLKALKLIDTARGVETLTSTTLPLSADGATRYAVISYNTADGNLTPTAVISATATTSGSTVNVILDGSKSVDPDGTITSYQWDFGDGSQQATNSTVSHAYATVGTYSARLTVTDNLGATASASYAVTVKDLSAPTAPTGLSARLTASVNQRNTKYVQLGWTAASDNVGVTGYEIYRNNTLLAVSTSTAYADMGTVPGASYTYHVVARDAAGNRSASGNIVQIVR